MSKKDKLTKEIDILREKRKDWFSVLFALVSAVVILVYAIISGEKPMHLLFVASVGLIAVAAVAVYYKKIESKLENKLVELEEEE